MLCAPTMRKAIFLVVVLALIRVHSRAQSAKGILPQNNLGYPVLISLNNGATGSGFYLQLKDDIYLVTAKHVLFDPRTDTALAQFFTLRSYTDDVRELSPAIFTVDLNQVDANAIRKHRTDDVVCIQIFRRAPDGFQSATGVTRASEPKGNVIFVAQESTKTLANVLVGNDVLLMGYPTSLGLQPMTQIDASRPLLRKGIVAGIGPNKRSIILDCPVYFGNSGGPVIEIDEESIGRRRFSVIGVVIQYIPFEDGGRTFVIRANSGYSVVAPMDSVFELIN